MNKPDARLLYKTFKENPNHSVFDHFDGNRYMWYDLFRINYDDTGIPDKELMGKLQNDLFFSFRVSVRLVENGDSHLVSPENLEGVTGSIEQTSQLIYAYVSANEKIPDILLSTVSDRYSKVLDIATYIAGEDFEYKYGIPEILKKKILGNPELNYEFVTDTIRYHHKLAPMEYLKPIAERPSGSYGVLRTIILTGNSDLELPEIFINGVSKEPRLVYAIIENILRNREGTPIPDVLYRGIAKSKGYSHHLYRLLTKYKMEVPKIILDAARLNANYNENVNYFEGLYKDLS